MTPPEGPALVVLAAGLARRYGGVKPLAPIGPHGEAVLDLLAGDARRAGFGSVVLVLHPETGPAIRYHVESTWPERFPVAFATQRVPLGTTHALLAALPVLGTATPFAVANADDVYGERALAAVAGELAEGRDHVLMAYRLANTIATDDPVTRGVCEVSPEGTLVALDERRQVTRQGEGVFVAGDGREPAGLDPDAPVSMNLWGFQPGVWPVFEAAMAASGLDEEAVIADGGKPETEVLLPEVVGRMVDPADGSLSTQAVRVLTTGDACIGVTHASDTPVVQRRLAHLVAVGTRPADPWALP